MDQNSGTNFKLYVWTQVQENYGAHTWDGKGACPQRWKFKGGNDYIALHFTGQDLYEKGTAWLCKAVEQVRPIIEKSDEYWREYILGWKIIPENEPTAFEADQLKYDGRIDYPARDLTKEAA